MAKQKTVVCGRCNGSGVEYDDVDTGRRMREARHRAGMGQRDVARLMGYSVAYISDLERGTRHWNDKLLLKYGEAVQ